MSIELIAPLSRRDEVLDYLQRKGVVELSEPDVPPSLASGDYAAEVYETETRLQEVQNASAVLARVAPVKKPLTAMLEPRQALTDEDFRKKAEAEVETALAVSAEVLQLEREHADQSAENVRLKTLAESVAPWRAADIPIRSGTTASTAYRLGSFKGQFTREELLCRLAEALPENDCVELEVVYADENVTNVAVLFLKSQARVFDTALGDMGFVTAPAIGDETPEEKLSELEEALSEGEKRLTEIDERLKALAEERDKLSFTEDFLTVKRQKYEAMAQVSADERIFVLQGYAAEKDAVKIQAYAGRYLDAAVEVREPAEGEDVPVILKNGFFAAPLENITGMYSLPANADIDPTGFMAFFYYLFFGMMLSDAGYGLIITLGTGLPLLLKRDMENKMKKTLRMYFFCGLSTVFWGAMYGSWFGDVGKVICEKFLHIENFNPLPPLWTDAVSDTMNVLIMCFVLGLMHLFWGVCMKGYTDIKNGHRLDALFDTVPTFLTVIGIAPIFFGLFVQDGIPEDYTPLATFLYNTFMTVHNAMQGVYVYILLAGLALVILTAGRHSKNIVGKLGGGLYAVYNLFSGYLGDVLSYARLLALGMATGVIGNVMNMLGTLPQNPVIRVISFVLVFIAGHAANLAINIIGAYVHTNRLQYVEFFSKFYEGGGRAFVPFNADTKYYRFKEEQ